MYLRLMLIPTVMLLAGALPCLGSEPADAAQPAASATPVKQESNYLRVLRDQRRQPIAMQTSVLTFRPGKEAGEEQIGGRDDVEVALIGAVHVGDERYYAKLNRLFAEYDSLLYELVAPEHDNVPQDGNSRHPVGQMQLGLKSLLGLSFQLEEIDYGKKNFVHADMSPREFARVMNERGETFWQMMLRMMGQAMVAQAASGSASDAELLLALLAPDRSLKLKRLLATQFENLEGSMMAVEGPRGSTLIGERNKKALQVLKQELAAGKKRIAIFYGAGHMPDMAARLQQDFGLVPDLQSIQWLTAWSMER